jgi:Tfp pilus assembly pilus retraction ATPase PilT
VTSPLWDIVFGTLHTRDVIKVPRRFVMSWLTDEQGRMQARFETDYCLR